MKSDVTKLFSKFIGSYVIKIAPSNVSQVHF